MVAVTEPSSDDVVTWNGLQDVFDWVGVSGDGDHLGTAAGSLLVMAGIDASTRHEWDSVSVFANVDPGDINDWPRNWLYEDLATKDNAYIDNVLQTDRTPVLDANPTMAERGCVRVAHSAARIAMGITTARVGPRQFGVWKIESQLAAVAAPTTPAGMKTVG